MAAARGEEFVWQTHETGKWDGSGSDCIATRAKGIYAAHCKEQQDAFLVKLGTESGLLLPRSVL